MKTIAYLAWSICAAATLAALVGCSSQMPAGPAQPNAAVSRRSRAEIAHLFAMTNPAHIAPRIHPNHRKSWMIPNAARQWLLYASDADTGTVDVYNDRGNSDELVGQITGFALPFGQCVDGAGDVYVTDFGAGDVVEFAHGGTTPINTLTIRGAPIGCSVDPTTGNLAVSAYLLDPPITGGLLVFPNASGSPVLYTDSIANFFPPGYDPSGNLFVEAGGLGLDELPSGGSALERISIAGTVLGAPGGVMWDGGYVAVADPLYQGGNTTGIYQIAVSGSIGTVVGSTDLTDSCEGSTSFNEVIQPFIEGPVRPMNTVLGGNLDCTSRFDFWNYAKGGNPKRTLPASIAPQLGSGQSISVSMPGP